MAYRKKKQNIKDFAALFSQVVVFAVINHYKIMMKYSLNQRNTTDNNRFSFSDLADPLMAKLFQSFNASTEIKLPISLEEATSILIDIVPDIVDKVLEAKLNCSKPSDDLTSDESASIMLYTIEWSPKENSLCYLLNKVLAAKDQQQLEPWQPYLKLLLHALSKLQSKCCTIYRGVMSDVSASYLSGCEIVSSEFTLCATSVKTLEEEQNFGNTGTRTLFVIESESSKDISQYSFRHTNDEILLMPDRRFKVVSCLNPDNDLHVIQMKEITSGIFF